MEETPDSLIPYDEIVQEALRAVVGRVLGSVERGGGTLPGNHHFYITFKTGAPGVSIPQHLRERFPDEMTIVLQNKFWDLAVDERGFQVGPQLQPDPGQAGDPVLGDHRLRRPGGRFRAAVPGRGGRHRARRARERRERHPGLGPRRRARPTTARTSSRSISAARSSVRLSRGASPPQGPRAEQQPGNQPPDHGCRAARAALAGRPRDRAQRAARCATAATPPATSSRGAR